ncbi:hypothetical protein GN156_05345 [bacterium LRH843]|nr:hypothetical protein [bacterium LRH843]
MKKIFISIAPFLFLAALVVSMNFLKHEYALDIAEKATIESYLSMFEDESKVNDESITTPNEQPWNEQ